MFMTQLAAPIPSSPDTTTVPPYSSYMKVLRLALTLGRPLIILICFEPSVSFKSNICRPGRYNQFPVQNKQSGCIYKPVEHPVGQ